VSPPVLLGARTNRVKHLRYNCLRQLYLEKPEDVSRYSLMIDYLRAQALGPAESRALIVQLAQQSPD
jgi:hypothetical protein